MTGATAERLVERWPAMRWFVTIGSLCIVAGGVVAAVTRPTEFETGPWVAAYLVLVGGVAQIVLGVGQAHLTSHLPRTSTTNIEAVLWNAAVAATIAGTLLAAPAVTTMAGLATAGALCLFLGAVRNPLDNVRRQAWAYRTIITFVLLSIPVGLVLAWLRHG